MSISRRMSLAFLGALAVGVLALALLDAAAALAGPTVTVRVEGESATLLPLTAVTLGQLDPYALGCPSNSANDAINLAVESVGGTWDHGGGSGDFLQSILGETHIFVPGSAETTWAVWIDDKWGGGICEDLLAEGDEVLLIADYEPEPPGAPTRLPLVVTGVPPSVQAGTPFTVDVEKVNTRPGTYALEGEGTPEPESGVTVSGGGTSAVSSEGGVATLTLASVGDVTLHATKDGDAPSAPVVVCVHNGNDGNCGTPAPAGSPPAAAPSTNRDVASFQASKGPVALVAHLAGLTEGHVFGPGQAPRILSGSVLGGASAISSISIELHRRYEGRCWEYDGVKERFVRARCGHGKFFKVSNNGVFSYLLPSALGPGRYVFDVEASDVAGDRTKLARGRSRIVFYVR